MLEFIAFSQLHSSIYNFNWRWTMDFCHSKTLNPKPCQTWELTCWSCCCLLPLEIHVLWVQLIFFVFEFGRERDILGCEVLWWISDSRSWGGGGVRKHGFKGRNTAARLPSCSLCIRNSGRRSSSRCKFRVNLPLPISFVKVFGVPISREPIGCSFLTVKGKAMMMPVRVCLLVSWLGFEVVCWKNFGIFL